MSGSHLKRITVPTTWPGILRKEHKYILRPSPGPHCKELSMPIARWLMLLGHAKTARDVRVILNTRDIRVDGRRVHNPRLPVGLMDSLCITESGNSYRVRFDKRGRLVLVSIPTERAAMKPCRVRGKKRLGKGVTQLSFHDGRTVRLDDKKANMAVGDTVMLSMPQQEMKAHLPFKSGACVLLIGGKHAGDHGTLKDIVGKKITYESAATKENIETLKKFAYVLPEEELA